MSAPIVAVIVMTIVAAATIAIAMPIVMRPVPLRDVGATLLVIIRNGRARQQQGERRGHESFPEHVGSSTGCVGTSVGAAI